MLVLCFLTLPLLLGAAAATAMATMSAAAEVTAAVAAAVAAFAQFKLLVIVLHLYAAHFRRQTFVQFLVELRVASACVGCVINLLI